MPIGGVVQKEASLFIKPTLFLIFSLHSIIILQPREKVAMAEEILEYGKTIRQNKHTPRLIDEFSNLFNNFFMNRTKFSLKFVLIASFMIFTIWIYSIFIFWTSFQILRYDDPLWIINILFPNFYLILFIFVFIIFYAIKHINNKYVHLMLISEFTFLLLITPYILTEGVRFPDTISVIHIINLIPSIFNGSESYANSFPGSYLLWYAIYTVTDINLFVFSKIFSALALIFIFGDWYLIIKYLFDSRAAFISTILGIPALIIEITISPNSLGMLLLETNLLLILAYSKANSKNGPNIIGVSLIVILTLVITHFIHSVSLFIFFLIFIILNKNGCTEDKYNFISPRYPFLLLIILCGWITYLGTGLSQGIIIGIIKAVSFALYSNAEIASYSVGTGNFLYPWIHRLHSLKFALYFLVFTFLIIFNFKNNFRIKHQKKLYFNLINKDMSIFLLILSILFLGIALSSLTLMGKDSENIVSRSLNYSMLAASTYIGISLADLIFKKSNNNALNILVIFLLLVTLSYPIYSYSRESYVSFPLSELNGITFEEENFVENEGIYADIRLSSYYFNMLRDDSTSTKNYYIYSNNRTFINNYDKIYDDTTFDVYLNKDRKYL